MSKYRLQYYMRRGNTLYFRRDNLKLKVTLTATGVREMQEKLSLRRGEWYDATLITGGEK